ncbi:hypothetical protein QO034_15385 [Sedimentitalea sp. JM2-8]|uniref:Uncharacterized protein n=1 Tax=Sedimentitalea xiamensis TaxID=3050037 RepID=A0ABT7FH78_9RHOB|nr:hypothetical protein [Sedimentitalea xiamensis]MDK3074481.1 hypothetical protein [Sedimentitalea xiamensis]
MLNMRRYFPVAMIVPAAGPTVLDQRFEERDLPGFAPHPDVATDGRIHAVEGSGNFGGLPRDKTRWLYRRKPRDRPPDACSAIGPNGRRIEIPVAEYTDMQALHPDSRVDATNAAGELYTPTSEEPGPFGSTGKIFRLVP